MRVNFFLIGAQKTGTTTVFDWLKKHPEVFFPEAKEIQYFAMDSYYKQGVKYLEPFYRAVGNEKCLGMSYVHLMFFPKCAERIYRYNPEGKIIIVLRNPIDRAYSSYWFARRNGWEQIDSFEKTLELEQERLNGSYMEQAELTYLTHGHYADQIDQYYDLFGKENVRVLLTEDLRLRPEDTMLSVLNFLGLSEDVSKIDFAKSSNMSSMPKNMAIQRILTSHDGLAVKLGALLPGSMKEVIRKNIIRPMLNRNIQPFSYPPISPEIRSHLVEYYLPHNKRLNGLINREEVLYWD